MEVINGQNLPVLMLDFQKGDSNAMKHIIAES